MADNSGIIADVLLKTNPELYKQIDGQNTFKSGIKTRGARVAKYRRYVVGKPDANMTDQMRAMLRLKEDDADLDELSINYMALVVDKMASRISVTEITTDSKEQASKDWLAQILNDNDFESLQMEVVRGAIRDGDSYVMIDFETGKMTSEPAYDGFSGIVAIYTQGVDYPLWSCKIWSVADMDLAGDEPDYITVMKIAVSQPDRISYWTANSGSQEVMPDEIDGNHEVPNLLGKPPIIHFVCNKDNFTQYGESEVRKALPPQNILNRTTHSTVMASEHSAFSRPYSIGAEIDPAGMTPGAVISIVLRDEVGNIIVKPEPEQIEFLKACQIGELATTDISQFTGQIDSYVAQISQVTGTPIYGISGQNVTSGEALKQLEIGLIGKVRRFQKENSKAVRLLIELVSDVQKVYDTDYGDPPELGRVSVNWSNPEILDVNEAIITLSTMREKMPGLWDDDFYRARIGALLEMTQSQIEQESEKARTQAELNTNIFTGAGGEVPPA
jgi:hypothetical protein